MTRRVCNRSARRFFAGASTFFASFAHLIDLFDREIADIDDSFGELLDRTESLGYLSGTTPGAR